MFFESSAVLLVLCLISAKLLLPVVIAIPLKYLTVKYLSRKREQNMNASIIADPGVEWLVR